MGGGRANATSGKPSYDELVEKIDALRIGLGHGEASSHNSMEFQNPCAPFASERQDLEAAEAEAKVMYNRGCFHSFDWWSPFRGRINLGVVSQLSTTEMVRNHLLSLFWFAILLRRL